MSTEMPLGMVPIGTLDDLLDRAQRGYAAAGALDIVKDELTKQRDHLYRKMLNSTKDDEKLSIIVELKAIEKLAQSLLVQHAQGKLAHETLLEKVGGNKPTEERPLKIARVASTRTRRASGTTGK